jgi:hypothetical protein
MAGSGFRTGRPYRALVWAAFLWAAGNCAYVYLVLGGDRIYRVETAVLILLALLVPKAIGDAPEVRPPEPLGRNRTFIACSLVAATWLAIALPLLGYPFLSDDYVFLDLAHGGGRSWEFFRPLFLVVFSALAWIGGESVVPFHVVSFALHLGSGALAALLVRRVLRSDDAAALGFAVFVLNPLQLEAVLWVSGLQELLWAFFLLAALVCYTAAETLTRGRLLATMVLLAAGLLSKETAVCFVLLLPAADWLLCGFTRGPLLTPAYAAFAALLAGFVALRFWFVGMAPGGLVPPVTPYAVKEFLAIPYQFFVQPWSDAAVAAPPWISCMTAIAALVLVFFGVSKGAGRQALAGAFVILAATLPLGSYFFVAADLRHARYLYFPATGWGLLVAALASRMVKGRAAMLASTALYAGLAALCLWFNLGPWNTASEAVAMFAEGVRVNTPLADTVAEWTRRTGTAPALRDGAPSEHKGVWLFLNGYKEFEAFVRRHRRPAPGARRRYRRGAPAPNTEYRAPYFTSAAALPSESCGPAARWPAARRRGC